MMNPVLRQLNRIVSDLEKLLCFRFVAGLQTFLLNSHTVFAAKGVFPFEDCDPVLHSSLSCY
jgi:hypothetical protein